MATVSITFGDDNDNFYGQPYDDDLIIQMGKGNDTVYAGEGTNLVYLGAGNDRFDSNDLLGGPFQESTECGPSTVYGDIGNDVFEFYDTTGTAYGGKDNDTYNIEGDSSSVSVVEYANEGIDTINIALWNEATYYIPDFVENLNVKTVYYWGFFFNDYEETNLQYELGYVKAGVTIVGNAENNAITGSDMHDTLKGGTGADTVKGGLSNDVLYGEDGNDVLWGEHGNDKAYGGAGNDKLVGHGGNDTLDGGANDDFLDGGSGNDQLFGGEGKDVLFGGTGADTMNGGNGDDTYVVDSTADKIVEAAGGGSDLVKTTLASYTLANELEALTYTGTGNFTGTGNGATNTINGGKGADLLKGMGGNDVLLGNDGADDLFGGEANDYLSGGNGVDSLQGEAGNDTLYGNNDADYMSGGTGNDYLDGGAGNDNMHGDDGIDVMHGGDGDDLMQGGAGSDEIHGGNGNDRIYGGLGKDKLYGDAGFDTFSYQSLAESNAANGRDFIYGFEQGKDKIDLSWIDANATVAGNQAFAFTGSGAFFKSAGDLWITTSLLGATVNCDVNGDAIADMQINVAGVWTMAASDFVL
ncbi:calcium-binding protein [Roseomonas sp. AR75]|uniref:calcium-binding protein n=1 Tax=Roseomonas sp. AR75 TaxID=2562311 RepID=UPI0010C08AB7|nr:calcium-binding protein [Roseomonas sp. AR75]